MYINILVSYIIVANKLSYNLNKAHNPKSIVELGRHIEMLFNRGPYRNNSKRKYVNFITNLKHLEHGGRNTNKYLKLATKTSENLSFFLLKDGVRGRKTMNKSKNEKKNP